MRRVSMKGLCVLPVALWTMACGQPMEAEQATGHEGEPVRSELATAATLSLVEQGLTGALESKLEEGNEALDYTEGFLRAFSVAGSGTPTLAQADAAVMQLQEYEAFTYTKPVTLSYAQARGYFYLEFDPLHPLIRSTYGTSSETPQVSTRYYTRLVAAGASGWLRLFVVLFPQSKKVIVFEQNGYET